MPTLYNLVTAVLAVMGCFSLLMTGEVGLLLSMSGLALLPGYYRLLKGRPSAPGWAIGLLSVLTLAVFSLESAATGDVFIAVAHLTIAFQAIKSFDLKEPWDHLQVYFMSLLQLIIASELTYSLLFGAVFVVFMLLFVTAMVMSHFLKEDYGARPDLKKPVLTISLLTLTFTMVIFVAVPRTPLRFVGRGHERGEIKTTGFSNQVDIGSFGDVKNDPTVVMRIEMKGRGNVPYYWRGLSLDYFDGTTWRNSAGARRIVPGKDNRYTVSENGKGPDVQQRVFLEPLDSHVIFGLSRIKSIEGDTFRVREDRSGNIFFSRKSSRGAEYTVSSAVTGSYPGTFSSRYLQLPSGMARVADLAKRITSGAKTDRERAVVIEEYLKRNYKYSLSTPKAPPGISPIENFLFSSKEGYCEHYATSMVVMLRSLGVAARIVNGFHGGERNKYGGYVIVRQSDAHSWVEALIDGMWTRFDPTPSVPEARPAVLSLLLDSLRMTWARYVIGFTFADQMSILRIFRRPFVFPTRHLPGLPEFGPSLYIVPISVLLVFAIFYLRRLVHYRRYDFVSAKFIAFRKILGKRGIKITPSTTAGEMRREARRFDCGAQVERFLEMYELHRFGTRLMSAAERKKYLSLLREIKKS